MVSGAKQFYLNKLERYEKIQRAVEGAVIHTAKPIFTDAQDILQAFLVSTQDKPFFRVMLGKKEKGKLVLEVHTSNEDASAGCIEGLIPPILFGIGIFI